MHPARPEAVRDRVAYIADMMRTLKWVRGKSAPILAEAWGLSLVTIEHYSTEASRKVCAEVNDPERVSMHVGLVLEEVIDGARDEIRRGVLLTKEGNDGPIVTTVNPNDARRSIISASETWTKLAGACAPSRVQVEMSVAAMNADELRAATVEAMRVLAQDDPDLLPEALGTAVPVQKEEENGD